MLTGGVVSLRDVLAPLAEYLDVPSTLNLASTAKCFFESEEMNVREISWVREACASLRGSRVESPIEFERVLCARAASEGDLSVLKWLRSKGYDWDERTCANAAWNGHIDLLRWARSLECPWNRDLACLSATYNGHVHVLNWAEQEENWSWNERARALAVYGKRPEVLEWGALREKYAAERFLEMEETEDPDLLYLRANE